jgi:hypothetical protein
MTYVSVKLTNYGMDNDMNHGYFYMSAGELTISHRLTYEDAVKALAKLAKQLDKAPDFIINYYNPSISYRELRGWIE